jgi:hypothetical protein
LTFDTIHTLIIMSDLESSDIISTVEINAIAPSATGSHVTVDITGASTSPPRKKARKNTRKQNTKQVTLSFSAVFGSPRFENLIKF